MRYLFVFDSVRAFFFFSLGREARFCRTVRGTCLSLILLELFFFFRLAAKLVFVGQCEVLVCL